MANIYNRVLKLEKDKETSFKDISLILSDLLQGKNVSNKKLKILSEYESEKINKLGRNF